MWYRCREMRILACSARIVAALCKSHRKYIAVVHTDGAHEYLITATRKRKHHRVAAKLHAGWQYSSRPRVNPLYTLPRQISA